MPVTVALSLPGALAAFVVAAFAFVVVILVCFVVLRLISFVTSGSDETTEQGSQPDGGAQEAPPDT